QRQSSPLTILLLFARGDGGGSDPEVAGQGLRRRGRRLLRVEPCGAAHAQRRLHRRRQALPHGRRGWASRWTAPARWSSSTSTP
uniref:Uncharacterized protein n=1 Tax=Aegilops tauschii subsp. strangulata TaxID=200361 RepID=A0A453K5R2_AEGTS